MHWIGRDKEINVKYKTEMIWTCSYKKLFKGNIGF